MAAQHLDMGIHGAVLAVVVVIPDLLQDLLTAEGDALVADKKNQQVKLLGGVTARRRGCNGNSYRSLQADSVSD